VPNPQSAAIYTRISSDPEGKRAGVERQREDCQRWGDKHGWRVAELVEDNDRSAYSGKPRPGYVKLLADLKNGVRDAVIVWHPDRLHRSPKELEEFIDVIDVSGAQVAMVETGSYDLTTSDGRFVARTLGNVAKKESEDKSRRVRRKLQDNVKNGKPTPEVNVRSASTTRTATSQFARAKLA